MTNISRGDALVVGALDYQSTDLELKPLGGSLVDSTFHLSKFDPTSTRTSGDLLVKRELSPLSGSAA